jgi:hypothetical protein
MKEIIQKRLVVLLDCPNPLPHSFSCFCLFSFLVLLICSEKKKKNWVDTSLWHGLRSHKVLLPLIMTVYLQQVGLIR